MTHGDPRDCPSRFSPNMHFHQVIDHIWPFFFFKPEAVWKHGVSGTLPALCCFEGESGGKLAWLEPRNRSLDASQILKELKDPWSSLGPMAKFQLPVKNLEFGTVFLIFFNVKLRSIDLSSSMKEVPPRCDHLILQWHPNEAASG